MHKKAFHVRSKDVCSREMTGEKDQGEKEDARREREWNPESVLKTIFEDASGVAFARHAHSENDARHSLFSFL